MTQIVIETDNMSISESRAILTLATLINGSGFDIIDLSVFIEALADISGVVESEAEQVSNEKYRKLIADSVLCDLSDNLHRLSDKIKKAI